MAMTFEEYWTIERLKEVRNQAIRIALHDTFDFEYEFIECDNCQTKPGHAVLCSGCLNNRATIEFLNLKNARIALG